MAQRYNKQANDYHYVDYDNNYNNNQKTNYRVINNNDRNSRERNRSVERNQPQRQRSVERNQPQRQRSVERNQPQRQRSVERNQPQRQRSVERNQPQRQRSVERNQRQRSVERNQPQRQRSVERNEIFDPTTPIKSETLHICNKLSWEGICRNHISLCDNKHFDAFIKSEKTQGDKDCIFIPCHFGNMFIIPENVIEGGKERRVCFQSSTIVNDRTFTLCQSCLIGDCKNQVKHGYRKIDKIINDVLTPTYWWYDIVRDDNIIHLSELTIKNTDKFHEYEKEGSCEKRKEHLRNIIKNKGAVAEIGNESDF